ncbi:alpha/beta-hydrolase [Lophiostoma macrostomum CBS 122681]|uniref:Alpha/beta-hydrolase n=1 Tax=Lophiostoma macrostomum CBS 122681 TaxID=1314788 RepID=A0A6A6TJ38_9PLEO|nr:alpha/beta-hydrolase [Lophiostoma macrostomum CBS 122681]
MNPLLTLLTFSILYIRTTLAALSNFDSWPHQRIQLNDSVSIHFRYYGSGPPILLVHGFPQHSLTWSTIAPILAQNYSVIVPDNRGSGDSSLSASGDYSAAAGGRDLYAILSFLNITQTYVFAHDKGVGLATSLALEHPSLVSRLILSEYPLPGFGYSTEVTSPELYQNWQLAFFAVPDAAEFFIQGREKEMLAWYFYHGSYSGTQAVSADHLQRYATEISKPGFLRAGLSYFAAKWVDEKYFTAAIEEKGRLGMPVLALGGEASIGTLMGDFFGNVCSDLVAEAIPKAGHWIGDENPEWSARRALRFFGEGVGIPRVDFGWLEDRVTLTVGSPDT